MRTLKNLVLLKTVSALCAIVIGSMAHSARGEASQCTKSDAELPEFSEAMPDLDSSELSRVLRRYYKHGLGGREAWARLESLRMNGTLKNRAGSFDMQVLAKKPNLHRQVLSDATTRLARGYNGQAVWLLKEPDAEVVLLQGERAECFALNALMGSQLLYPLDPGKKIELIDTLPSKGGIHKLLRVSFKHTPITIDYYLEVPGYLERKRVFRNPEGIELLATEFESHKDCGGVPIPFRFTSYREGQWLSTYELKSAQVNAGVMPWMFAP